MDRNLLNIAREIEEDGLLYDQINGFHRTVLDEVIINTVSRSMDPDCTAYSQWVLNLNL